MSVKKWEKQYEKSYTYRNNILRSRKGWNGAYCGGLYNGRIWRSTSQNFFADSGEDSVDGSGQLPEIVMSRSGMRKSYRDLNQHS